MMEGDKENRVRAYIVEYIDAADQAVFTPETVLSGVRSKYRGHKHHWRNKTHSLEHLVEDVLSQLVDEGELVKTDDGQYKKPNPYT